MTVATTVEAIVDGPTRYNVMMSMTNRAPLTFKLENAGSVERRIDGIAPFDPEVSPNSQFILTVFDPVSRETAQWYYDAQERAGATAIPGRR